MINDDYVTEAEDVELLVNTYAKNILSYSNVAIKRYDKYDYLKDVYNRIEGESYLPEQLLVDKLYRHHKQPKVIYKNSLNKEMVVNALSVDYANDSIDVTLIEL